MRADFLLLLQERWTKSDFVLGAQVMAPVRMIKTADEIEAMRRSAATADVAVNAAWTVAKPGVTEIQVARAAGEALAAEGAVQFRRPVVATGPNSAFPHHSSGDRHLNLGEPLLVDFGGQLAGYASDITRMAYFGKPSVTYSEVHAIVEQAVCAAMEVVKPGATLASVDLAARDVIEQAGYGKRFITRIGHGIGITGHEPPSVTKTNEMVVQEGMTFSVEPGIYLAGQFGVRLEEIVVVTGHGAERLSRLPREVRILEI